MSKPPEMIIREALAERPDAVTEISLATRDAVLQAANKGNTCVSELLYVTYCVSLAFSFTGKLGQGFIHIATNANHVNLGFNRGVELKDPDGLLNGTGKLIRHIRVNSKSELKTKPIKKLITLAVKQGKELAEAKGGIQPAVFITKDSRKR